MQHSIAWYIPQTYIKLGICYKEQKDYDLALENLKKGIEITDKNVSDPEIKHKWLAIANLFVAEIEQLLYITVKVTARNEESIK